MEQSVDQEQSNAQKQSLRTLIQTHKNAHLLTAVDRNWYEGQIERDLLDRDKFEFYLEAAGKRQQIVDRAPNNQKKEVFDRINKILDIPSQGRRAELKGEKLLAMQRAVELFGETQNFVHGQIQKLKGLPSGFEDRLWSRFNARFMEETSGDYLDESLMKRFRQSVDTTFKHLSLALNQQDAVLKKIKKEKAFLLLEESGETARSALSHNLELRLEHWLSRKIHLTDWDQELNNLLQNQFPSRAKEFKEHYNDVFDKKFWGTVPKMLPVDFPNFTTAFNFTTETEFLTQFSIEQLKNFPNSLKKALNLDLLETLKEGFSFSDQARIQSRFASLDAKKPSEILNFVQNTQKEKEKNIDTAKKQLTRARQLDLAGEPEAALLEYQQVQNKFGRDILSHFNLNNFFVQTEHRANEVKSLREKLRTVTNPAQRETLEARLKKLIGNKVSYQEVHENQAAYKAREKELLGEIESLRKSGNLHGAKAQAERLYHINTIKGYSAMKVIEKEEEKLQKLKADNDNTPQKEKQESGHDKLKKIEFLQECVETAKAVKEECKELGIPQSPEFWGSPEGVKNRVKWLKNKGLYSKYVQLNSSDPNIPSAAQASGFRFRWLDAYQEDFTANKAETGLKYLTRFKESGHKLMALAGAFSMGWTGLESPTYTPDEFIDRINARINRLSGQKAA